MSKLWVNFSERKIGGLLWNVEMLLPANYDDRLTCLFLSPSWRPYHSSSSGPLWWRRFVPAGSSPPPAVACCTQCPCHPSSCFLEAPTRRKRCCCPGQRSTGASAAAGGRWCARRLSGWFAGPRRARSPAWVHCSSARCRESCRSAGRLPGPTSGRSWTRCCRAHSAASEAG